MNDWQQQGQAQQGQPGYQDGHAQGAYAPDVQLGEIYQEDINAYVAKVFGWMFIGLLVTAAATLGIIYMTTVNYDFSALAMQLFIPVVIVELVLVVVLSARVTKMNPFTAKALYLVYAALNGLTFGFVAVLFAYAVADGMYTVAMAFGITAATFGVMAAYGLTTKQDLTRFGNLFKMALIGLIIAIVANMFFGNGLMDLVICVAGLFIFMGLVAYDTNKIKNHYAHIALAEGGAEAVGARIDQTSLASNLAIVGALMLYLDFINMFWFILRLLGRNR